VEGCVSGFARGGARSEVKLLGNSQVKAGTQQRFLSRARAPISPVAISKACEPQIGRLLDWEPHYEYNAQIKNSDLEHNW
jgi:hypothetical protein